MAVGLGGKHFDLSLPPAQLIPSSALLDSDPFPFSDFDLLSLWLSEDGLPALESAESGTNFFLVLIRFLAVETTTSSLLDFLKRNINLNY